MTLQKGDRLGDWVVDKALGEGGMGSVFRCHSVLAEDVRAAVKVLKASDVGNSQGRFVQELRTLSALNHPAIVRVLGGGRDEKRNLVYMAMELVDGEDLADRLARGPMSGDEAVRVFGPVADALAYAHARGVAHRDIKPANIMLREDGTPVVVDFGIAVAEGHTRYTKEGLVPGTMVYLPPEIFEGAPPDPKSTDAYAFGVVVWEAVTGRPPFAADPSSSEGQQMAQVMGLKLRSEELDPGAVVPGPLREAIRRTTDPEPDTRLIDLAAVRDLITTGQTDKVLPRKRRKKRSGCSLVLWGFLALTAVTTVLLTMVGVGAGAWWFGQQSGGGGTTVDRPPVDLAATLDEAARALERGDVAAARRSAGLALDDHPEDPHANLLYGQVLLADGDGLLSRPYLCAAVDGGLGDKVPGHASGDLDCERGPGAASPLTTPLALAKLDLSQQVADAARMAAEAGEAVAMAEEEAEEQDMAPRARREAPKPRASAPAETMAPMAPPPPSASAPVRPEPLPPPAAEPEAAPPPADVGGTYDFGDDEIDGELLSVKSGGGGGGGGGLSGAAPAAPAGEPQIRLTSVSVTGSVSRETVQTELEGMISRMTYCYEVALEGDPSIAGDLTFEVVVNASGAVTSAMRVLGTLDPDLTSCLAASLKRAHFPPSDGLVIRAAFRLTVD